MKKVYDDLIIIDLNLLSFSPSLTFERLLTNLPVQLQEPLLERTMGTTTGTTGASRALISYARSWLDIRTAGVLVDKVVGVAPLVAVVVWLIL